MTRSFTFVRLRLTNRDSLCTPQWLILNFHESNLLEIFCAWCSHRSTSSTFFNTSFCGLVSVNASPHRVGNSFSELFCTAAIAELVPTEFISGLHPSTLLLPAPWQRLSLQITLCIETTKEHFVCGIKLLIIFMCVIILFFPETSFGQSLLFTCSLTLPPSV